jgi:hypothetical protein
MGTVDRRDWSSDVCYSDLPENAHPYPNPFKPNTAGLGHTNIIFTGLPDASRIRIVDMAGEPVFDRQMPAGEFEFIWDATNSSGKLLASGVYFYIISNENGTKKGKLSIIR